MQSDDVPQFMRLKPKRQWLSVLNVVALACSWLIVWALHDMAAHRVPLTLKGIRFWLSLYL